jgi:uncharacterized protein (TIGR02145 family)
MKMKCRIRIFQYLIGFILISACSTLNGEDNIPSGNTITDIDGNVYHIISIGTQVWMTENLKTTKFSDGTRMDNITDNTAWNNLIAPGYCFYHNDTSNKNTYGGLYNWYAVNTQKICPSGWHVPSDAEWTTLTNYLGGESVAGCKLKEAGNRHWISSNAGATNESGFAALPGGNRIFNGVFEFEGVKGSWWTSTSYDSRTAWQRVIYCIYSDVSKNNYFKRFGFSVRCIKD